MSASIDPDGLAKREAEVEHQIQFEIWGQQAREDSLQGAQAVQTGGPARSGAPRDMGNVAMVSNGNWDAALNIGADPAGISS